MKTAIQIINESFAQKALGDAATGDPVADVAEALRISHPNPVEGKSAKRMSGWGIFRADGTLTISRPTTGLSDGDSRTWAEAFADEVDHLGAGTVFVIFGFGISVPVTPPEALYATYDARRFMICEPAKLTTFDATDPASTHAVMKQYRARQKAAA